MVGWFPCIFKKRYARRVCYFTNTKNSNVKRKTSYKPQMLLFMFNPPLKLDSFVVA
jgi:hypothetical protein